MKPIIMFIVILILVFSFQNSFARPADNIRVVDSHGNSIDKVKINQQIQITRDISWHINPMFFLSLKDECPNPTINGNQMTCGIPTGYTYSSGKPIYANDKELPFVHIVQVSNLNEKVIHLSWTSGNIDYGQGLTSNISWTPQKNGEYMITSYIWKNMEESIPYNAPVSLRVMVE